jgi:hypothetical protein
MEQASFAPLIPEEIKTELANQINTVINKIIKKY